MAPKRRNSKAGIASGPINAEATVGVASAGVTNGVTSADNNPLPMTIP